MVNIVYIDPTGTETTINAQAGWSIMQAGVTNGVDGIVAECGGSCACATCHVYLEGDAAAAVPAASDDEAALLTTVVAEQRPNSRLSCQIKITDKLEGLIVSVAEKQD